MIRINQQRLWQSIDDMARIGATANGGSRRLALSREDVEGRRSFVRWCEEAGCEIHVDPIGNIFACRAGTSPDAEAVMCGSHLDTQPLGGRFDGVYGVLAGLEAVRTLNDHAIATHRSIVVVNWTNEEGARFAPGLIGSAVYAGSETLSFARSRACIDTGMTLGEELDASGFAGSRPYTKPVKAYYELHIEQGPILEAANVSIGVVTGIQGIYEIAVTIGGFASHGGTTPMKMRRDALTGAASMIARMTSFATEMDEHARLTVGQINCQPNSPSTIPDQVRFSIDTRHPDPDTLRRLVAEIEAICREEGVRHRLKVETSVIAAYAPVAFHARAVEQVRAATSSLDYSCLDLTSGAGHDAMNLAAVTEAAMIFVPCKDGLSHNEYEDADPTRIAEGASVLATVLLSEAGEALA
ncbi:Zn-dependent hydrolase [Burkholderia gladioli]|uniref:Zn-dependent hydrolase n=1 Tax=Burkholderia gladioli TaxID=28095 RepID=UPI0022D61B9E|nr:Zn-dependent hydrolase [Burkholderia gladioli]MDA0574075.1 Zn-dependent hydrolase [Burkholderia gladioli]MDA0602356.1 Zn-dependent hydrolase [Burkholderia gladioli]